MLVRLVVSLGDLVKGGRMAPGRPVTGAGSGRLPHSQRGLWVATSKPRLHSWGGGVALLSFCLLGAPILRVCLGINSGAQRLLLRPSAPG